MRLVESLSLATTLLERFRIVLRMAIPVTPWEAIRRPPSRRANYTLGDDLHVAHGSHNLTFGFHGEDAKVDVNNLFQQPRPCTFNANVASNAIASFLTGYVQSFSQASG